MAPIGLHMTHVKIRDYRTDSCTFTVFSEHLITEDGPGVTQGIARTDHPGTREAIEESLTINHCLFIDAVYYQYKRNIYSRFTKKS